MALIVCGSLCVSVLLRRKDVTDQVECLANRSCGDDGCGCVARILRRFRRSTIFKSHEEDESGSHKLFLRQWCSNLVKLSLGSQNYTWKYSHKLSLPHKTAPKNTRNNLSIYVCCKFQNSLNYGPKSEFCARVSYWIPCSCPLLVSFPGTESE